MALRLLHLNSSYIESDQRTLPLQSLELSIKHLEFISDWVLDSHQNSCFNKVHFIISLWLHNQWFSYLHCVSYDEKKSLCRNWVAM